MTVYSTKEHDDRVERIVAKRGTDEWYATGRSFAAKREQEARWAETRKRYRRPRPLTPIQLDNAVSREVRRIERAIEVAAEDSGMDADLIWGDIVQSQLPFIKRPEVRRLVRLYYF